MPRELLIMQNSFAWTDAEGRLITVDKALRCNARSLLVEGKTFNNIYKMENLKFTSIGTGGSQELKSDGYFYLNKIASDKYCDIVQDLTLPIKSNTAYTLVVDIRTNTLTGSMDFNAEYMDRSWFLESAPLPAGVTGRKMYKLTSKSTFLTDISARPIRTQLSPSVEGILEYKAMLFEGDYTNDYIPSNVDGIESVAEREAENGVYPLQITQSNNETDGIILPNGVTNVIENNNTIKKVGKYTITGYETGWGVRTSTDNYYVIQVDRLAIEKTKTDYGNPESFAICDKIPVKNNTSTSNVNSIGIATRASGLGFIISIPKSELTEYTIPCGIEWLKAKGGITVWYELSTPITEPCVVTEVNTPIPLRSLPNGVCDEVVGNKLIQRVYELKLDEKFDFATSVTLGGIPTDTTLYRFDIKPPYPAPTGDINSVISNMFPYLYIHGLAGGSPAVKRECVCNHSNNKIMLSVIIKKERLSSVDVPGFKEWCIANNFKMLYQLYIPIEHTINIPPISIAKGTNMVTTNNNIKPELTFKYKRKYKKSSTNNIKYLYNLGNECLNITGGWNTQLTSGYGAATTIVKNTNNIYFPTGVWNMLLTNNKIDVTNYDVVYMKYSKEYSSFQSHPARCAIKLGNKNTSWTDFADDKTTGALIGKDETENNVTNGILTIDVSNVTGSYYVGIGGQSNNITVHEIGLKMNNGDTITLYSNGNENEVLTGGYLTSSNNSATCNIEKQADNLYVNCTGKTSFDSICYARTNKTIKPCKIKVSVKNNYISANGIAFCVFLSEKEAITSVSDFNSVVNKKYIKASNTTPNEYIDLEMDLTDSTEGYFYIACMVAGNTGYTCTANIRKIEIIR